MQITTLDFHSSSSIMALARERTLQSLQSMQGFDLDPSSLDFFGGLQDSQSIVNFETAADHPWACSSTSSVLSFEQGDRSQSAMCQNLDHEEGCAAWIHATDYTQPYPSVSGTLDCLEDGSSQKRAYLGDDMQAAKKLCSNNRKAKAKPSPAKDPQSMAAKNRRERISERLKILQELVPNGTKVDLVTMLEKAISYVKFLQLQVKVLATDEFWPAQGGKAPEVAQVKEAIDAILSSHRGTNSSSKNA